MTFATLEEKFNKANCKLAGLSVDGLYSHIAWLRTIICYPLSIGRNFDELYRVLIALQTTDAFDCAAPADWRPGDDVIVPPAGSCGTAEDRMGGKEEGVECVDWFFFTKKISEETIWKTLLK
jgi:peroxiredoxin (alkyl hydroperoxide reductase subunit C)